MFAHGFATWRKADGCGVSCTISVASGAVGGSGGPQTATAATLCCKLLPTRQVRHAVEEQAGASVIPFHAAKIRKTWQPFDPHIRLDLEGVIGTSPAVEGCRASGPRNFQLCFRAWSCFVRNWSGLSDEHGVVLAKALRGNGTLQSFTLHAEGTQLGDEVALLDNG